MPNWCDVNLKVSGEEAEVKNFFNKHIVDGRFDFDTIIPQPKTKEECPVNCLINDESHVQLDDDRPWFNWYEWRWQFWGVKWNASNTMYGDGDDSVSFETPWNDPRPILVALTKMYPTLTFDYSWIEEQGAADVGHIIVKNSEPSLVDMPDPWTKEAYEMMFSFWDNREDYVFDIDDNCYEYIDDELRDEYDEFVKQWKNNSDRVGQEPPCIEEWYNNEKKEVEAHA